MVREGALEIVGVEVGRGVDDRTLAVVRFQLVHEDLHLLQHVFARRPLLAARRAVPFDVEDRRQRALDLRHVADEPVGLLARRAAPVEEVIGAALQPGPVGIAPVLAEHRVEMVAAIGRLDVDEVRALPAQLLPVDVALPARDVDAVHGELLGRGLAEIDRLGVAEPPLVDDDVGIGRLGGARALRRDQCRQLGRWLGSLLRCLGRHRVRLAGNCRRRRHALDHRRVRPLDRTRGLARQAKPVDARTRGAGDQAETGKDGGGSDWQTHEDSHSDTDSTRRTPPKSAERTLLMENYQERLKSES